jgi:hypothetical protein
MTQRAWRTFRTALERAAWRAIRQMLAVLAITLSSHELLLIIEFVPCLSTRTSRGLLRRIQQHGGVKWKEAHRRFSPALAAMPAV